MWSNTFFVGGQESCLVGKIGASLFGRFEYVDYDGQDIIRSVKLLLIIRGATRPSHPETACTLMVHTFLVNAEISALQRKVQTTWLPQALRSATRALSLSLSLCFSVYSFSLSLLRMFEIVYVYIHTYIYQNHHVMKQAVRSAVSASPPTNWRNSDMTILESGQHRTRKQWDSKSESNVHRTPADTFHRVTPVYLNRKSEDACRHSPRAQAPRRPTMSASLATQQCPRSCSIHSPRLCTCPTLCQYHCPILQSVSPLTSCHFLLSASILPPASFSFNTRTPRETPTMFWISLVKCTTAPRQVFMCLVWFDQ